MKFIKLIYSALLLAVMVSCGTSSTKNTTAKPDEHNSVTEKTLTEDADLITSVYCKFVFAIDSDGDDINSPEKYFTANALRKLQDDYEFDCDEKPCYAYYALRTDAQDSRPGSDEASLIHSIEPTESGWYIVSYSDMGWPGKTRIRIADGKIDDYERL